ncbi:hypothetical protein [Clostridium sp. UBA871]|uniref:hypothetical protein n=1 Tax=Clostridium sp. UBA871 TaxID=1946380 RepID=UPI0032170B7E
MTDKERIKHIDTILKQIKENGFAQCVNIYENNPSIGLLYYSSIDIKSLKSLKKKLISFQNLDKLHQTKIAIGKLSDKRLEVDKPKKVVLKHIDLNSII